MLQPSYDRLLISGQSVHADQTNRRRITTQNTEPDHAAVGQVRVGDSDTSAIHHDWPDGADGNWRRDLAGPRLHHSATWQSSRSRWSRWERNSEIARCFCCKWGDRCGRRRHCNSFESSSGERSRALGIPLPPNGCALRTEQRRPETGSRRYARFPPKSRCGLWVLAAAT